MIVVRNTFQLKFGQARPAVALWKEGRDTLKRLGMKGDQRLLTDLVGPSYTLVFENTFESLSAFERDTKLVMGNAEWRAWYDRFIPLCESASREIFTIVD